MRNEFVYFIVYKVNKIVRYDRYRIENLKFDFNCMFFWIYVEGFKSWVCILDFVFICRSKFVFMCGLLSVCMLIG